MTDKYKYTYGERNPEECEHCRKVMMGYNNFLEKKNLKRLVVPAGADVINWLDTNKDKILDHYKKINDEKYVETLREPEKQKEYRQNMINEIDSGFIICEERMQ